MLTYKKVKTMRNVLVLTLLATTLVSGCNFSPDLNKPDMKMPSKWSAKDADPSNSAAMIPLDWWNEFEDANLTKLIEEGLAYNADLQLAAARVAEARAALSFNQSNLFFPTIGVEGGANRTSNSKEASNSLIGSKPYNTYSIAAVLNYELDLWGRLRNASSSAQATLLSIESNREAVRLAVAADIANSYFNMLAIDAQIAVTEDTIKGREENYKYQETQFKYGAVNSLTYKQAESELASSKAALPTLKQARQEQESALAVLLGRSPYEIVEGKVEKGAELNAIPVPPVLPSELPSTLLTRRPDIQAAEQTFVASNSDVGVARADYFPTISLNALIGLSSADADRLFRGSARNWQGGASLAGPLLDFGRTSSNVDVALSRKDQAAISYQQTIRNAFKDVVDSISSIQTSDERVNAQVAQNEARDETLRQAQLRYKAGYSNYLEVLDAQRFLYQAQLERIVAERDRLTAAVNLYKALGGGWQEDLQIKPEDIRDNRKAIEAEKQAAKVEQAPATEPSKTETPAEKLTPVTAEEEAKAKEAAAPTEAAKADEVKAEKEPAAKVEPKKAPAKSVTTKKPTGKSPAKPTTPTDELSTSVKPVTLDEAKTPSKN